MSTAGKLSTASEHGRTLEGREEHIRSVIGSTMALCHLSTHNTHTETQNRADVMATRPTQCLCVCVCACAGQAADTTCGSALLQLPWWERDRGRGTEIRGGGTTEVREGGTVGEGRDVIEEIFQFR